MFVYILEVYKRNNGEWFVKFFYTLRKMLPNIRTFNDSEDLVARWKGNEPKNNHWYYVELEIEEELIFGQHILPIETDEYLIKQLINGEYILRGKLEVQESIGSTLTIYDTNYDVYITGVAPPYSSFVEIKTNGITLWETEVI